MLIPFLKISAHYSASDRVGKVRKIKTQRLKSESSGDWQKEKDQTTQKKEGSKKEKF
ncbi:hypothetical protein KKKH38_14860 [Helicobacter pylori]